MPSRPISVETADEEEHRQLLDALTLAFAGDPLMRWLFPTPHEYLRSFPGFAEHYGGRAFEMDTAFYVGNYAGAALWLPPGTEPDEAALAELAGETLPEEKLADAWTAFDQLGRRQPDDPHWHLPLVGVEPAHQGQGFGTALVEHTLARCDRQEELAYLESANPRNLSLYLRCGFELLEPVRVGSMPPIFPMIREPEP